MWFRRSVHCNHRATWLPWFTLAANIAKVLTFTEKTSVASTWTRLEQWNGPVSTVSRARLTAQKRKEEIPPPQRAFLLKATMAGASLTTSVGPVLPANNATGSDVKLHARDDGVLSFCFCSKALNILTVNLHRPFFSEQHVGHSIYIFLHQVLFNPSIQKF